MFRPTLYRDPVIDARQSADTNSKCYTLGPLKAGLLIRVPVRLGIWLADRATRRKEQREAAAIEAERNRPIVRR